MPQTPRSSPDLVTAGLGRRDFLAAAGGGLALLAVQGCTNSSLEPPAGATPSDGSTDSEASFPATVTHRFGKTTIPAQPQRVVALGQTDCDPLIALGVSPVAVGSFVDSWYTPFFPWNEHGFSGGKVEEVSFVQLEFEKIAALQPDLITMISGGISKSDYQTLSKICPVVGPPVGYEDYAVPYGPHTELIGQCVGKPTEAAEAVARLDEAYEAARAANPGWSEMTSIHAECYTGTFYVLGENAPRTTFLTSLGFTLSPELSEIVGEDYSKEISAEELDLVGDLDLVVWCTDAGAIANVQDNPVVSRLESVREGNAIWISGAKTDEFMWAMDWSTVLSGPYAIEHGVPLIESALAGGSPLAESDA